MTQPPVVERCFETAVSGLDCDRNPEICIIKVHSRRECAYFNNALLVTVMNVRQTLSFLLCKCQSQPFLWYLCVYLRSKSNIHHVLFGVLLSLAYHSRCYFQLPG